MKMLKLVTLLLCFLPTLILAQGPGSAAVPFLQIGPSPALGASQGANSVLPTNDTYGFYYNPAQLGVFSRDNNFSVQFYPKRLKWLPQFNFDGLYLTSKAFTAGYVVEGLFEEMDVNIGMGYMRTFLNLGENIWTDINGNVLGVFNSHESYDAYSIGLGFEYYALFSFGYTYKKINSNLAPAKIVFGNETTSGTADATSYDLGMMIEIPLLESHLKNSADAIHLDKHISMFSNAYLGYSVRNIGDFVNYGDVQHSDPLPKTANLGLGFSIGLIQKLEFTSIRLLEINIAQEAQDLLIKYNPTLGKKSYQSGIGDINIFDHILLGNPDDQVQVNSSLHINLAESIFIGIHKMKGPGYPKYVHNIAWTVSTRGIFKLFANPKINSILNDIFSHIDLRYSQSNISSGKQSPLHGTKYSGLSVTLHGLF